MKAIILAAGYATRLFPLTENFPKPLIEINGRPMIDIIMDKLGEIGITDVYVVTNAKYFPHFEVWSEKRSDDSFNISIINDQTTSNDDRLGAIGDIKFTIEQGGIDDDILVIGGDNIFKFSLEAAADLFREKGANTIVAYDVGDRELAKHYAVIELNDDQLVVSFEEKPAEPKSTLSAICVYFYPKKTLALLDKYLADGNNPDAPGNLASWLSRNDTVYACKYTGEWFDIGGFESLKEAKERFGETNVDIESLKQVR